MGRAILEGIVSEAAENAGRIRLAMPQISEVITAGGLTECSLINQMTADFLNIPVRLSQNRETTSIGGWMVAARALGIQPSLEAAGRQPLENSRIASYRPDPAAAEVYRSYQKRKSRLYQVLKKGGFF